MPDIYYKEILDNLPLGYVYSEIIKNEKGQVSDFKFLAANNIYKKKLGLEDVDIIGKKASEIHKDNYKKELLEFIAKINARKESEKSESSEISGNVWDFLYLGYEVSVFMPEVNHFLVFITSVTTMRKKFKILDHFFSINRDLFCVMKLNGEILKANREWESVLGYPLKELEGKNILDYVHPEDLEPASKFLQDLTKDKGFLNITSQYCKYDGSPIYLKWIVQVEGRLIYAVARDITKHKILERDLNKSKEKYKKMAEDLQRLTEELHNSAHYDQLTNLPNRRLFFERLRQEIRESKREDNSFALLFIDLDDFKSINDQFGHEIGDQLLIETASRISGCLRESDTRARMGGDEFTVILRNVTDKKDIRKVARELLQVLHQPFYLNDYKCSIGASIGISIFPEDGQEAEILLDKADKAMYRVKNKNKRSFCFYKENECELDNHLGKES